MEFQGGEKMSEMNRKFTPSEIRRMMNLSVSEMSRRLGISHMTLQRREKGESEWKASEIQMISEMSDIPIDRISFLMPSDVR